MAQILISLAILSIFNWQLAINVAHSYLVTLRLRGLKHKKLYQGLGMKNNNIIDLFCSFLLSLKAKYVSYELEYIKNMDIFKYEYIYFLRAV